MQKAYRIAWQTGSVNISRGYFYQQNALLIISALLTTQGGYGCDNHVKGLTSKDYSYRLCQLLNRQRGREKFHLQTQGKPGAAGLSPGCSTAPRAPRRCPDHIPVARSGRKPGPRQMRDSQSWPVIAILHLNLPPPYSQRGCPGCLHIAPDREASSLFYPWTTWSNCKLFLRLTSFSLFQALPKLYTFACLPCDFFFAISHAFH